MTSAATAFLRVVTGPEAGRRFELRGETVVGREGADVTIEDPELSRRHAVLRPTAHGVVVEDLGSSNGTFVNGRRIEGPTLVGETATLRLGGTELELGFPAGTQPRAVIPPREETTVVRAGSGASTSAASPRSGGRRIGRRTVAAAGVVVALLGGGAAAAAAAGLFTDGGAKTHRLDIHGVARVVDQVGRPGTPGSSQVAAAQVSGPPGGDGAVILRATVGPGSTVDASRIDGIAHIYFKNGSFTTHYAGRAVLQPDGSYHLTATEKVIGSAGAYSGASGTLTTTGVNRLGAPTNTFHVWGTIKY